MVGDRPPKGQVDWERVGLVRSSGREGATADSPTTPHSQPPKGTGICPVGLSSEVRPSQGVPPVPSQAGDPEDTHPGPRG